MFTAFKGNACFCLVWRWQRRALHRRETGSNRNVTRGKNMMMLARTLCAHICISINNNGTTRITRGNIFFLRVFSRVDHVSACSDSSAAASTVVLWSVCCFLRVSAQEGKPGRHHADAECTKNGGDGASAEKGVVCSRLQTIHRVYS